MHHPESHGRELVAEPQSERDKGQNPFARLICDKATPYNVAACRRLALSWQSLGKRRKEVSEALMFISGFVSGLVAQSAISELLDELFGSLDPVSLEEAREVGERPLVIAS